MLKEGNDRMLGPTIIVALLLMLLGAIPAWPYSREWGYYPSTGIGVILVLVFVVWLVTAR